MDAGGGEARAVSGAVADPRISTARAPRTFERDIDEGAHPNYARIEHDPAELPGAVHSSPVGVRMRHGLPKLYPQGSIADRLAAVLSLAEGADLDDDAAPRARENHGPSIHGRHRDPSSTVSSRFVSVCEADRVLPMKKPDQATVRRGDG